MILVARPAFLQYGNVEFLQQLLGHGAGEIIETVRRQYERSGAADHRIAEMLDQPAVEILDGEAVDRHPPGDGRVARGGGPGAPVVGAVPDMSITRRTP